VRGEEWTVVCRYVKAVRDSETHSVKEGVCMNPSDDNKVGFSDASDEEDMEVGVMPYRALMRMFRGLARGESSKVLGA
jgi:hypothetical protein